MTPAPTPSPVDGGAAFPSHWRMRETAHVNGGSEWFGYKHQCIEDPRLSRFDKYKRVDRSVTSTWRVDGQDCADKADALQRLSVPPVVTDDEAKMLAVLSNVPMSKAELTAAFPAWKDHYYALSEKGLTWWEAGKVRLTDLGTALVAARVQA